MKRLSLSRRNLLAGGCGTALATATLDFRHLTAATAPGNGPSTWPEFSFLVVSDTHLGRNDNNSAERQWTKTAAELAKAEGTFVLHLGDVVDQGREPQYAIYRGIRDSVGKPFHEIPGNHDPTELFEKHLEIKADRSFDHGGVRFILFGNAHTDSHDGFISEDQLAWIDRQCAEAAEKNLWLIVCAHVPIHTNKPPDRAWYVKPENGQTGFYEILDRHRGRVLAVFHGHFHNGIRGWDDRAPLQEILFPSALYNQDRGLAAKNAPGYNLPEFRPGYVAAQFADGKLDLNYVVTGVDASEETVSQALPRPAI